MLGPQTTNKLVVPSLSKSLESLNAKPSILRSGPWDGSQDPVPSMSKNLECKAFVKSYGFIFAKFTKLETDINVILWLYQYITIEMGKAYIKRISTIATSFCGTSMVIAAK